MRGVTEDLTNQRFGRWTAIRRIGTGKNHHVLWLCKCDCGTEATKTASSIRSGQSLSCGCVRPSMDGPSTKHGKYKTSEYDSWHHMKSRCLNPKDKDFKHYAGRGITMCERWKEFKNFYEDMGPKPLSGLSLDRIDVNGNYEPSNCRWATIIEQRNNRRDSR